MNPLIAKDYIESALWIKSKDGALIPFRMNAAQKKLYAVAKAQQDAGKPVRLIILKARQLGFSTLTEALLFHMCATRQNVNALVVAHREDATGNLFRMSKLFYDSLPAPLKPMLKGSNAKELIFENPTRSYAERELHPGLRSRLRCATAGGKGIGRSDTLQAVHLSEYAFWPEGPDGKAATLSGILQAVPAKKGTMVVIESTANGFDHFKELWDAAVAGENDFQAVFFPWYENPDYTMPPPEDPDWTGEELQMQELYRLTDGQLAWRRWCIANNCSGDVNLFHQEYPSAPEEAFLHSGTGVFDNAAIIRRKAELTPPADRGRFSWDENPRSAPVWESDENGEVKIWEYPQPGHPYVIGGDTAGEGSDRFTAIVMDNSTGHQVATLMRRYSEPEYVRQVWSLGRFYNNALLGIEANFSTYPVMRLADFDYPNQYYREREDTFTGEIRKSYGFRTDRNSRPRAIANLVEVFAKHPEWYNDEALMDEMLSFVYNEDHRPEAMAGKHDDLVMAAAITYTIRHNQSGVVPEERPAPPEKLIDKLERGRRSGIRN